MWGSTDPAAATPALVGARRDEAPADTYGIDSPVVNEKEIVGDL